MIQHFTIVFLNIFLLTLLTCGSISAQKSTITVRDSLGKSLQRVSVKFICIGKLCSTSSFRIATDSNGKAENPYTSRTIIQVSHVGFLPLADTLESGQSKIITLRGKNLLTNQVVITGQITPGNVENSLYKVRVIDRERINAQAATTARDVLASELNIRLSQDNILGTSMSLQGLSGQNVKILVDGVPVIGRQDGNIDLSQISLSNVERIEIIEGPLATIYGTDALAGAINFISRSPGRTQQFDASLHTYNESAGQHNIDGRIEATFCKTSTSLSGGRNFFGGYAMPDTSRFKQWKPREQYMFDLRLGQEFERGSIRYDGSYFNELIINRGLPRAPYFETAFDDTYSTVRTNSTIFFTGTFLDSAWKMAGNVAYNHFRRQKNTVFKSLVTLENTPTSASEQDTSTFASWFIRGTASRENIITNCNLQLGYDLALERGRGQRIDNDTQSIQDYAAFGIMHYSISEQLIIQPGLRLAYNTRYAAPVIPSLNIKYSHDNLSLRLSYSRGFRAPALKELFLYFVDGNHNIRGNTNLQAEYSHNTQLSMDWKSTLSDNMALTVESSGYFNDIRNLITLSSASATEYSYFNVDRFQTLGARGDVSLFMHRLQLTIGGAYTGRYNQIAGIQAAAAPRYSFSPEVRLQCEYTVPEIEVKSALWYKYTGKLPQIRQNVRGELSEGYIEAYHTLDMTFSKAFFEKTFLLSMGVKNLANVQNLTVVGNASGGGAHTSESSSTPYSYGRTFFLALSWDWQ